MASTPEDGIEKSQFLKIHSTQSKRKGGRKPIYATSEERKQRNRQAQAAFRERRTEYIAQLEDTVQKHETSLQDLWTKHHIVSDECLMLRYKNSLLSRILLERGIDITSEISAMTDPQHRPEMTVQDQTLHRLAFQHSIYSAPVEEFPTPVPNGQLISSNNEQLPAEVVACSEQLRGQDVVQKGIKLPLHNRQEMGITGSDNLGGIDLPRQSISAFQSHIQQLEKEYDLDYRIDDQEPDAWRLVYH